MKNILLLEDDPVTTKLIQRTFSADFRLVCCETISSAENALLENNIDLLLLDRKLPDGDGIEICKKVKAEETTSHVPVIFLSSCDSESERIFGFYTGADDYVTKPFSIMELKARVAARMRNRKTHLETEDISIDLDGHTVHLKSYSVEKTELKELLLTRIEFKLLVYLLQNKNTVLPRELLLQKIWGYNTNVTDRVVDIHISHLRKKLQQTQLKFESLRGEGYKLVV